MSVVCWMTPRTDPRWLSPESWMTCLRVWWQYRGRTARPSCTSLHSCFKEQSSQGKTTSLLAKGLSIGSETWRGQYYMFQLQRGQYYMFHRAVQCQQSPGLAREVMQHLKTCGHFDNKPTPRLPCRRPGLRHGCGNCQISGPGQHGGIWGWLCWM